jgi:cobalt-zinc-cadmium efflux system membrane fusion protein
LPVRLADVARKVLVPLLVAVLLSGGVAVGVWWKLHAEPVASGGGPDASSPIELAGPKTLAVPEKVIEDMHIEDKKENGEVREATARRPLELYGQLVLDTDRLVRIRPRFAGEVVRIGTVSEHDPGWTAAKGKPDRPLAVGDRVKAGKLLVEIWSKDLGEKKSELVDNLSQLWLDEDILDRQRKAPIPERSVLETERRVQADRIAVARAERTLRSWRLDDAEIQKLYDEARRLRDEARRARERTGQADPEEERQRSEERKKQYEKWARVEITAPFDGIIVEKNVTVGDLVDATIANPPLFQVADFSQMLVWAWPYEEDLPALQKAIEHAKPEALPWTIRLKADPSAPPLEGTIDDIRPFVDPTQHTPGVTGHVRNPSGQRFISGLSITATVELLGLPDEWEVPATAIIPGGANGAESFVFAVVDPARPRPGDFKDGYQVKKDHRYYALRRVTVARRLADRVFIRSQAASGGGELLKTGDAVVTSGAVELRAALEDLQDTSAKK